MQKVVQIKTLDDVNNKTLRQRVQCAKGGRSVDFIFVVNHTESALLSYEDWREESTGFIYEIFVLPVCRKHGIGSFLLSYAEEFAIKLGCTTIRLKAHPLDEDTDLEKLIAWYTRKGYLRDDVETKIMEKRLAAVEEW